MIRHLALAFVLSSLAACGFHLRNSLTLPSDIGPVTVVAKDPYSPLAEALAQALQRAGGQASAEGPKEGVSVLNIVFERWGNTPISVDARGRSQEYTLRYATIFELRRADGSVVVPRQSIELARDYISVATQSEGTEGERELLAREMRREMVTSILRRVDAVSKAPQPVESDTTQSP